MTRTTRPCGSWQFFCWNESPVFGDIRGRQKARQLAAVWSVRVTPTVLFGLAVAQHVLFRAANGVAWMPSSIAKNMLRGISKLAATPR
jgi:hypothetical protein